MRSQASTPEEYLAELPADRRELVAEIRDTVNAHLPEGYVELMDWGMITWAVPLEDYAETGNGKPLAYAAVAAQKNYVSLYLMGLYSDGPELARFKERYEEHGLRLDMGKSCVRVRDREDLDWDAVGEAIASIPAGEFVARYETTRSRRP